MKIVVFVLAFVVCNISASEFISPIDLLKSMIDVPATGKAVGTVFVTDLDTNTASGGTEFSASTGTCFAISKRHLLTGSHTLDLIGAGLKDCLVSMADVLCERCALPSSFKGPLYKKVKNITREPDGANLAILELDEDLDVTPLALGQFKQGPATGISTAAPTLLGTPGSPAKLRHAFSYGGFSEEEEEEEEEEEGNTLESWFVVPTTVTADVVRRHAITSREITCVGYACTSVLTHGDDGAPILQGNEVVAVCNSWKLCGGVTIGDKPMNLLTNTFTLLESYTPWIKSIVSPKKDTDEAKGKEKTVV